MQHNKTIGTPVSYLRIESSSRPSLQVNELWKYRELFYFLTWRDVKIRYKQTVLGIAWALIQPLLSMIVFTLFFGELAGIASNGIPYPVFSYTALVPWTFFATALARSSNSLVGNANLIKKVYFPRVLVPVSATFACIFDFLLAFLILILMMVFYGIFPSGNIIFLPFFILLSLMTSLGAGLWLSALNVQFRDIRYTIPFLTQLWLFVSPVVYPSTMIENDMLRTVYGINPMVGVIEGFRWTLLDSANPFDLVFIVSFIVACILFGSGVLYFQRTEHNFADVV